MLPHATAKATVERQQRSVRQRLQAPQVFLRVWSRNLKYNYRTGTDKQAHTHDKKTPPHQYLAPCARPGGLRAPDLGVAPGPPAASLRQAQQGRQGARPVPPDGVAQVVPTRAHQLNVAGQALQPVLRNVLAQRVRGQARVVPVPDPAA